MAHYRYKKYTNGFVVDLPLGKGIYLVKIGSDERPASWEDIAMTKDLIVKAFSTNGSKAIVTNHTITIEKIED